FIPSPPDAVKKHALPGKPRHAKLHLDSGALSSCFPACECARHCIIGRLMSLEQAGNAFDLLGQAETLAVPVRLPTGDGPQLEIGWGSFHQGIGSSIGALLSRAKIPRNLALPDF